VSGIINPFEGIDSIGWMRLGFFFFLKAIEKEKMLVDRSRTHRHNSATGLIVQFRLEGVVVLLSRALSRRGSAAARLWFGQSDSLSGLRFLYLEPHCGAQELEIEDFQRAMEASLGSA
jgi:hypothetical protein